VLYWLYRFGIRACQAVSTENGYRFASRMADIYYIFAKKDKESLAKNLKIILKTDDDKIIKRHIRNVFRNFAKYLSDFFKFAILNSEDIKRLVKVEGRENIDKVLEKGKGGLFVTAHLGNWEMGAIVVGNLGYSLYALALPHKDKRINDFFLKQRSSFGAKTIPIGSQIRNCIRLLKNNDLLAIVGDRDFANSGQEADFFGRRTILPKGPAFFSLKTGAPILPTFVVRNPDNAFTMYIDKPISINPTGNKEKDLVEITKRYVSVMEHYIRSYPDQWYAFREVWNT